MDIQRWNENKTKDMVPENSDTWSHQHGIIIKDKEEMIL
jgi:hypothetical protein